MVELRKGKKLVPPLTSSKSVDREIAASNPDAGPGAGRADDHMGSAADPAAQRRSPGAVLLITGVGMRGGLEDNLRYRVEQMFSPPVPVLLHRYGVARSGSLFRPCQQAATRRLAARLRALSDVEDHESRPPDVIAHSFGG